MRFTIKAPDIALQSEANRPLDEVKLVALTDIANVWSGCAPW